MVLAYDGGVTCPGGKWASEGRFMVGCGGNGLGMGGGGTYLGQEVMLGWLWLLRPLWSSALGEMCCWSGAEFVGYHGLQLGSDGTCAAGKWAKVRVDAWGGGTYLGWDVTLGWF